MSTKNMAASVDIGIFADNSEAGETQDLSSFCHPRQPDLRKSLIMMATLTGFEPVSPP